MTGTEILRFARISPCLRYRYALGRLWDPRRSTDLTWCMINPSTADAERDDPTIRRCMDFAKTWGFGGMAVVNLFAYRSPDPRDLLKTEDPVGPDNDQTLRDLMTTYHAVVVGWGASVRRLGKLGDDRIAFVRDLAGNRLWHLGMTEGGYPRHPLYINRQQPLVRWNDN